MVGERTIDEFAASVVLPLVTDTSGEQAECDFDGGDCCASTCKDGVFKCRDAAVCHMQCLDPHGTNAGCDGRSPHSVVTPLNGKNPSNPNGLAGQIGALLRYRQCDGETRWIADGHCDPQNNNHR